MAGQNCGNMTGQLGWVCVFTHVIGYEHYRMIPTVLQYGRISVRSHPRTWVSWISHLNVGACWWETIRSVQALYSKIWIANSNGTSSRKHTHLVLLQRTAPPDNTNNNHDDENKQANAEPDSKGCVGRDERRAWEQGAATIQTDSQIHVLCKKIFVWD